ncbi:hypothetical protein V2W45_1461344 [Cenococcum geophilum]
MAKTQHHNTNSIPRRPRNQLIPPSMHSPQDQLLRPLHSLPRSHQHNRTSSPSLTGNSPHHSPETLPTHQPRLAPSPPAPFPANLPLRARYAARHVCRRIAALPAQPAVPLADVSAASGGWVEVAEAEGEGPGGAGWGGCWDRGCGWGGTEDEEEENGGERGAEAVYFVETTKGRREGPFGAGGVLGEGGKGGEAGSDRDGKLRKLGGKAGTLMDFWRTGRLGDRFRVAAAEQKLRSVKLEIV